MIYLVAGVVIWSAVHFLPTLGKNFRDSMAEKMGPAWRGVHSIGVLAGLGLIIFGWMQIEPEVIYDTPDWGMQATGILVFLSLYFFAAANGKSKIRRMIRHPQLTGMFLWGFGHLFANGEDRSIVLFGGLALWALAEMVLINRRDGEWVKPDVPGGVRGELVPVLAAVALYLVFVLWAHQFLFGVTPLPHA